MSPTMNDVDPDALFFLLKGEPGTRKSTSALSFPTPQYWISTDQKMSALILPMKKWAINKTLIEFDDYTNWDKPRMKLEQLEANCKYKTVIIDSLTGMGDSINQQTVKMKGKAAYTIGNIAVDTIEDYKAEASAIREMLSLLTSIRKFHKIHVVVIAHVVGQRVSGNESNKLTHHSRVLVTGGDKISAKISSRADEAYHFNIRPGVSESAPGDYTCMTTHTGNDYARTVLELPMEIVFNDKPLYSTWIAPAINKMKQTT